MDEDGEPLPTIEEEDGDAVGEPSAALQARPDAASLAFRTAAGVVWCGDFNYRIDLERYAARNLKENPKKCVNASPSPPTI